MSHKIKTNKKIDEAKTWAFSGAGTKLKELPEEPEQSVPPVSPVSPKTWKMKGGEFEILPLPEVLPQKEESGVVASSDKKCSVADMRFQKQCSDSNLSKGCGGQNVQNAQNKLIEKGFNLPRFGADCRFGSETKNAVKSFQSKNSLPQTGKIDQATHDKLFGAAPVSENKNVHMFDTIHDRNNQIEKLVFERLVKGCK
jgi:hypothetical protein